MNQNDDVIERQKQKVIPPDEIAEALDFFTDAEWAKLKSSANYFAQKCALSADDLVNESILKALSGERVCPGKMSILSFLIGAMKSIANNERNKKMYTTHSNVEIEDVGYELIEKVSQEISMKAQFKKVEDIFADDEQCSLLLMALSDELTKEEMMAVMDVDETTYATIRTRFKRKLTKNFPKGLEL